MVIYTIYITNKCEQGRKLTQIRGNFKSILVSTAKYTLDNFVISKKKKQARW